MILIRFEQMCIKINISILDLKDKVNRMRQTSDFNSSYDNKKATTEIIAVAEYSKCATLAQP